MDNSKNRQIEFLENIHIPLWLFKDLCWLMSWRFFGLLMAIPTIIVAIIIVVIHRKDKLKLLPNLSVLMWILANAQWMLAEFYELPTKNLSMYPFILGIASYFYFVYLKYKER